MQQTHNLPKVSSILTTPIDGSPSFPYNTKVNIQNDDSHSKIQERCSNLRGAANGDFFLDVKNPKLFKKVRRYYENNGVVFSGDPLDDYDILVDCLVQDLDSVEAV